MEGTETEDNNASVVGAQMMSPGHSSSSSSVVPSKVDPEGGTWSWSTCRSSGVCAASMVVVVGGGAHDGDT
jgi:hypothetical protein